MELIVNRGLPAVVNERFRDPQRFTSCDGPGASILARNKPEGENAENEMAKRGRRHDIDLSVVSAKFLGDRANFQREIRENSESNGYAGRQQVIGKSGVSSKIETCLARHLEIGQVFIGVAFQRDRTRDRKRKPPFGHG